jgi:hypothetical protein
MQAREKSDDQNRKDRRILNKNHFRAPPAQNTPGLPCLYNITYRIIEQASGTPIINKVKVGSQVPGNKLRPPMVTRPDNKYNFFHTITFTIVYPVNSVGFFSKKLVDSMRPID